MTTFWGSGQVHVRERLLQHRQEADSRRAFGVQARCWRSTLHATGRSLGVSMGAGGKCWQLVLCVRVRVCVHPERRVQASCSACGRRCWSTRDSAESGLLSPLIAPRRNDGGPNWNREITGWESFHCNGFDEVNRAGYLYLSSIAMIRCAQYCAVPAFDL
jgi:hypothetical protein